MLLVTLLMTSCSKPISYGNLTVNIGYSVNGKPLITDSLCYTNEAGNEFLITEIQWFISNLMLQNEQGEWVELSHQNKSDKTSKVFYIDTNIPESQTLQTASIPIGEYKALRFTFGLDEEDNQTGLFSNPPETNMFWPEPLGGGYHYMKLNGKYLTENNELAPLNIHLGIGQNEDHTEFYQNYFTVELPLDLNITENADNQLYLIMIIDNWFRNPNLYDFNEFGSAIMQNQTAQQLLKENGQNVFTTMQNLENENNIAMKNDKVLKGLNQFKQNAAPKPHFWTWKNVQQLLKQIKDSNKNRL